MAGLGFKDFSVGEVMTSADVDGYLMQQSVMRFADSGARGSALGTATGTGVPLAEGMVSYLDDVNLIEVYDGAVWKPTGRILQVSQSIKTDTFNTNSTSYQNVTGLSVSVTPSSSSSKILVIAYVNIGIQDTIGTEAGFVRIDGGGSDAFVGDASGSQVQAAAYVRNVDSGYTPWSVTTPATIVYLASPATMSPVTFQVQIRRGGAAAQIYVNRAGNATDDSTIGRTASSITAIEVAA